MAAYFDDFGVECDLIEENGMVTHVSEVFCELTEFRPDECVGQTITYLFRDMLRLSLSHSDIVNETEAFLFTKSLEARKVRIQLLTLRKNDLDITKYIIFEIPQSRIEEKALYLEQLCSSNVVGIAVYSVPDLILLKTNEKYLNFLNPPYNEKRYSIGARSGDIFSGGVDISVGELLREALQTGRTVQMKELEYIGPDKALTYWDLVLTPLIENGRINYIVSNTFEVTERVNNRKLIEEQIEIINSKNHQLEATIADLKQKEDELHKQQEYLEVIMANMDEGLFLIKPDRSLAYVNDSGYKIFHQHKNIYYVGDTLKYITYYYDHGEKLEMEDLPSVRVLKGETINNLILKAVNPEKTYYLNINGRPIYHNGQLIYAVVCTHDVTALAKKDICIQQQKDQLIGAINERNEALQNAMKIKDEFLYTITHELKTPITVISAALQAMDLVYKEQIPGKAIWYIKTIRQNINRQMRLVNNLLDITRINSGTVQLNEGVYDLVFLTRSIVKSIEPIAQDKELNICFTSELSTKEIQIDEEKFERILLNLLSNSIKFTPKGNSIAVHLFVRRHLGKKMVCVSVQDEGIGIPRDKQYFIFERFGQVNSSLSREAEGTGIGLYLVKLLITAMDGRILLKSEMGKGSKFTVMFPDKTITIKKDAALPDDQEASLGLIENRLIEATSIELSDIYL